jgi:hypothetical protein
MDLGWEKDLDRGLSSTRTKFLFHCIYILLYAIVNFVFEQQIGNLPAIVSCQKK